MPGARKNGKPDHGPDMKELMARLAEIRAEVESGMPRQRSSSRLAWLLALLAALALLPLVLAGPCTPPACM